MKSGYIDTSFLLSILFQDQNYSLSIQTWNSLDIHLSSMLLEVESNINVYKYCISEKKDNYLYRKMDKLLGWHLNGIHRKNVDREIVLEIENNNMLKKLKSLDSIHLATASIFSSLTGKDLLLCSYDSKMNTTASLMGMKTLNGYQAY